MGCIMTICTINLTNNDNNNISQQQHQQQRAHARDRVITLFETIVTHAIATQDVSTTTGHTSMAQQPTASENTTVAAGDWPVDQKQPRAQRTTRALETHTGSLDHRCAKNWLVENGTEQTRTHAPIFLAANPILPLLGFRKIFFRANPSFTTIATHPKKKMSHTWMHDILKALELLWVNRNFNYLHIRTLFLRFLTK